MPTIWSLRKKLTPGLVSLEAFNKDYQKNAASEYRYGLRRGIVVQREYCEVCGIKGGGRARIKENGNSDGSRVGIMAHHYDYRKPFDVVFLCGVCHFWVHSLNPPRKPYLKVTK